MPNPTDPITRSAFLALAGFTERDLDTAVLRGQVAFWLGTEPPRAYLVIDAVVAATMEMLASRGLKRNGLRHALPGLQMVLSKSLVAEEAVPGSGHVAIGITIDGKGLAVLGGTLEQMRDDGGLPASLYGFSWTAPIRSTVAAVIRRARRHKIELPPSLAMPHDARPAWAQGDPAWVNGALKWTSGRTDVPPPLGKQSPPQLIAPARLLP